MEKYQYSSLGNDPDSVHFLWEWTYQCSLAYDNFEDRTQYHCGVKNNTKYTGWRNFDQGGKSRGIPHSPARGFDSVMDCGRIHYTPVCTKMIDIYMYVIGCIL